MKHPTKPIPEWRFPLDESKKAQSLSLIRRETAKKHIRSYPTFLTHVWNQLRFQPLSHRLIQGGLLLAAMLLALRLRRADMEDLTLITTRSVFFVFAGNICLSQVARLFSWHMAELEQTLYLNLKQMISIRMLEAGTTDLIILALFLGITGGGGTIGIGASLVYMLVPFLWSDILYLCMLVGLRSITYGFRSFVSGLLCGILALLPVMWEPIYDPKYLIIWQILTVTGLILLVVEVFLVHHCIDLEITGA